MLNKAEVVLTGDFENDLFVGGGIYLHDTIDNIYKCEHCGIAAYAEDALSDKTAAEMNNFVPQGRSYIAVVTPHGGWQDIFDGTLFSVQPYELGDTLTDYFGA